MSKTLAGINPYTFRTEFEFVDFFAASLTACTITLVLLLEIEDISGQIVEKMKLVTRGC